MVLPLRSLHRRVAVAQQGCRDGAMSNDSKSGVKPAATAAGVGAAVGAGTSAVIGTGGLAIGGTAVAVGLLPFAVAGGLVGLAGYGIWRAIKG